MQRLDGFKGWVSRLLYFGLGRKTLGLHAQQHLAYPPCTECM